MSHKMTEISSHFCIFEPAVIQPLLLAGLPIPNTAGRTDYASLGKIVFSQDPSSGEQGLKWAQEFRAVVQTPSVLQYNGRRKYIGVYRGDGSLLIMGSATSAPLIIATPYENAVEIHASFDAVEPSVI